METMFWKIFRRVKRVNESPAEQPWAQKHFREWGQQLNRRLQEKAAGLKLRRIHPWGAGIIGFAMIMGLLWIADRFIPVPKQGLENWNRLSIPLSERNAPGNRLTGSGIEDFRRWLDSVLTDSIGRQAFENVLLRRMSEAKLFDEPINSKP